MWIIIIKHKSYTANNSWQSSSSSTIMQSKLCTYLNGYLLEAPCEYVLHGHVPGLDWTSCWLSSISIFLVCSGPPSILLFVPTTHVSHSNPPLPAGQLNTSVQVNNMATLHHRYTVTHIYITFILLFIPFFILLPLLWAGRLAQTLLVCHNTAIY
jgi:hypothetical protein